MNKGVCGGGGGGGGNVRDGVWEEVRDGGGMANYNKIVQCTLVGIITRTAPLTPSINMLQLDCLQEQWSLFSGGGVQKLAEEYSIPFLGSIPLDPVRNRMRTIHSHLAQYRDLVNMLHSTLSFTHTHKSQAHSTILQGQVSHHGYVTNLLPPESGDVL